MDIWLQKRMFDTYSYVCYLVSLPDRRHNSLHIIKSYLHSHIQYFRFDVFCTNIMIVGDLSAFLCRFYVAVKIYKMN